MSDSFSGYKRRYIGGATADSVKFLQRFSPSVNEDAATKKYVDDTAAGSGSVPGGADTNVQYNDGGVFGGDSNFTFDSGSETVTATNITASSDLNASVITAMNDINTVGVAATSTVSSPTIDVNTLNTGSVSCTNYNSTTITLTGTATGVDMNTAADSSATNLVVTDSLLVGSGTTDASAIVTANSTTRAPVIPPMTTATREAIAAPAAGLMVYDTDNNALMVFDGTFWVYASRREPTSVVHATMSTSVGQTGVSANTVIVFPIINFSQGSAISYDTGTGVFSLQGGRRYRLTAAMAFNNATVYGEFAWAVNGGAEIGVGQRLFLVNTENAINNQSSGCAIDLVYAPVSNTDVVMKCVITGGGSVEIRSGSHCVVHEII